MKVLFIGDVYGQIGLKFLEKNIAELKSKYKPNLVIANGENVVDGRGIDLKSYKRLMSLGINYLTMGNHTFKNAEIKEFINDANIVNPVNDESGIGLGYRLLNYNDKVVLIINALGSYGMDKPYKNAFKDIEKILVDIKHDYSILDFHAEATSEKIALAHFLDGRVDAIVGTHTHVQTNDARILPKGTLYISDVGMTGALNGVIGVDAKIIIDRFIDGYTVPNKVADGKMQLNAVLLEFSPKKQIQKIHLED